MSIGALKQYRIRIPAGERKANILKSISELRGVTVMESNGENVIHFFHDGNIHLPLAEVLNPSGEWTKLSVSE